MCGRRGGAVKHLRVRRAKLLNILNSNENLAWSTSEKLHAGLDHIKSLLAEKKKHEPMHTTTYTAIQNISKILIKTQPPQGTLIRTDCEYTYAACTDAPTQKQKQPVQRNKLDPEK